MSVSICMCACVCVCMSVCVSLCSHRSYTSENNKNNKTFVDFTFAIEWSQCKNCITLNVNISKNGKSESKKMGGTRISIRHRIVSQPTFCFTSWPSFWRSDILFYFYFSETVRASQWCHCENCTSWPYLTSWWSNI